MSRVDVHPEELIDAARRGDLDAAGRRRLDAHLEHCTACATELAVGDDFAAVTAPMDGDGARLSAMVSGALLQAGVATSAAAAAAGTQASAASLPAKSLVLKVAGTALTVGVLGGAAVALWMTGAFDGADRPAERREPAPMVAPQPAPTDETRAAEPGATEAPAEPEATEAPAESAPTEPVPAPEPPVTERPAQAAPTPTHERPARPSAAELLARANEARRRGDYDEAVRWYRTLQRSYPSSREAAVSEVTLGRLLLDGVGEPARALAQFDRYLAEHPGGVLGEEARVGKALALQRLGRTAEEREAWRDLLRHHPDSLHAERARARLGQE